MSDNSESWQWVDEDPFEKVFRPQTSGEAGSPVKAPVECCEPLRFEEVPGSSFTIAGVEPHQPTAYLENLEQAVESTAETVAPGVLAPTAESYSAAGAVERKEPPAAHFDLAVSLEKAEQWEAAADSFRRALDLEPARAEALIGLGACLLHLDRAEEALHCFEQCLFLNAERSRALLGKAVALQKLESYEASDRVYRELLQITPNAPEPLANLIALSVARRDTIAVAEFSRKLLRVDARNKSALQGLAILAIWDGDQRAVIDYCTRLIDVDPVSFEGWYNLGFANQRMRPAKQALRSIA